MKESREKMAFGQRECEYTEAKKKNCRERAAMLR
jgi:hypothetical protein